MRRHKIMISPDAREMIKKHIYFLAQVSPEAAKRLKKEMMSDIRSLEQMPERFPLCDLEWANPDFRKMLVAGRYLVFFLIVGGTVYVEYVVDGRQDYKWILQ